MLLRGLGGHLLEERPGLPPSGFCLAAISNIEPPSSDENEESAAYRIATDATRPEDAACRPRVGLESQRQ